MKQIPNLRQYGWLCGIVCLFAVTTVMLSTGCTKTPELGATNEGSPKMATSTTTARGVMHSSIRNHKKAARP